MKISTEGETEAIIDSTMTIMLDKVIAKKCLYDLRIAQKCVYEECLTYKSTLLRDSPPFICYHRI